MATVARLPIVAARVGDCVRTVLFRGLDLTGTTLELQARLVGDTPGAPLLDLTMQAVGVEGISIGAVTVDGADLPTTPVVIRIAEATMKDATKVPYTGELGDPGLLAYNLVGWGGALGPNKRLLIAGELIALATVYGSDNAPSGRVPSFGRVEAWGGTNTATVQWDDGTTVELSIDGADVQAAYLAFSKDALAQAQAAAAEAVAAGTVAGALAAEQTLLPPQDYFRPDRANLNAYWDPNTGTFLSNRAGVFCTHQIAIPAGATQFFTSVQVGGGGSGRIVYFDANLAFAGSDQTLQQSIEFPANAPPYTALPIPANARYLTVAAAMVSMYGAQPNTPNYDPSLKVFFAHPNGNPERGFGRLPDRASLSPVSGMTMVALTDSRFDAFVGNYNPWLRIARALDAHIGLVAANNPNFPDTCVSGRVLANALTHRDGSALQQADFANVSVVMLAMGCNDCYNNVPVGTPQDTPDMNTVYGNLLRITSTLIGWNPLMSFFIVTPYYRIDAPMSRQQAYQQAYLNFGQLNNIQVYDHFIESGIGPLNQAALTIDGVHANNIGVTTRVVAPLVNYIRSRLTAPTLLPYESSNSLIVA